MTSPSLIFRLLKPLASLRLTVVLFVLSIILVFFGTLALIDNGMWTVIREYFQSTLVWIKTDLLRQFLTVFFWYPKEQAAWTGSIPFPGGVTLAVALLANMTAAHVVRFKFTWNRLGIITLHAGLIMLLAGELITRFFAVEQKMVIKEGETTNYTFNTESPEIAIQSGDIYHSISKSAIQRSFKNQSVISSPELPVDIRVTQSWVNTKIAMFERGMKPEKDTQFAANEMGTTVAFSTAAESSGTESGSDTPSVSVTIFRKGTKESLGQFFLSFYFDRDLMRRIPVFRFPEQKFEVDGQSYTISLRPRRMYKPYTIGLKDFTHEKYAGTQKAKDFASTIRLVDPHRGEDREVRIWMNNPLRYDSTASKSFWGAIKSLNPFWNDSETFFQSSFLQDDEGTILQVVQNPSWMWPYVSCILITVGMLVHFLMVLTKSIARSAKLAVNNPAPVAAPPHPEQTIHRRFIPIAIGVSISLLCGGWMVSKYRLPKSTEGQIDYNALGAMPVLEGGRIQPLDSFARNTLTALTDSESYQVPRTDEEMAAISAPERMLNAIRSVDGKFKSRPAIEWLLSVIGTRDQFDSEGAKYRIFRIDNLDVVDLLGLERRPGNYRYSPAELKPNFGKFIIEYDRVRNIDVKKRSLLQTKIFELGNKLKKYQDVVFLDAPLMVPPRDGEKDWINIKTRMDDLVRPKIEAQLQMFVGMLVEEITKKNPELANAENPFLALPKEQQRIYAEKLRELEDTLRKRIFDDQIQKELPEAAKLIAMFEAGRQGKMEELKTMLDAYRESIAAIAPADVRRTVVEQKLNHFDPFLNCMVMFVFAFLMGCLTWLAWEFPRLRLFLWTTSLGLLIVTLAVQLFAMGMRMYLMDRMGVFVTNLYGSAVFIGTCISLVCILLEFFSRLGIGTVVAASLGFATTYIARHLQSTGDTLAMVEAVLDTNLWLSTHVTTVTFGYAATLIAGAIALLYLVMSSFTKILSGQAGKTVSSMLYGTICFATLLSFVGTVLGGIWADQSWGRFWGWDPKENGALLIVAWNALILHARWAGLVKARGVAILALAGISVTMWSWFGTNQLGIGLHSYGFSNTLAAWCTWTWIATGLLTGLFMTIPESMWRSRSSPSSPAVSGTGSNGSFEIPRMKSL
jgi:ABC-type transport system involved in cytochrome c biogenesis permease subunit